MDHVHQQLEARVAALEAQLLNSKASNCGYSHLIPGNSYLMPKVDPINSDALTAPPTGHIEQLFHFHTKVHKLLGNTGVLAGTIFYLTVPANKKIGFTVKQQGAFEVGVKISGSDTALYWRRNSYEPNLPETVLDVVTHDRYFQFEGLRKFCWVLHPECAQIDWQPVVSAALVSEKGDIGSTYNVEIMWDDSRSPAQFRNLDCAIRVFSDTERDKIDSKPEGY